MADTRGSGVLKGVKLENIVTSSIGDVSTIRSKLHERRAQLNQEITVENRIRQGSKKLSKMSSNTKSRDLANLEHEFSKSKIQVLQAELSKINSSLQAYQPERVRSSQVPLIPVALKTTSTVPNLTTCLSNIIRKHYHTDPALLEDSIQQIQELRNSMATPTKDQAGIDLLYQYYSNLILIIKRFIHPSLPHGIAFIWHDAINGLPAAQKSTAYEKACVIFNIAAIHTQIAAQQDRSTQDGIDKAINHLENSLGAFEYMKHNFSHSPTLDMTTELLSLLSDLMRAQVVELKWEKQVLQGLTKEETTSLVEYAQKNKLVSECYKPIRDLVEDATLKDYLPSCWSAIIKIKDAHYRSQAHYYASIIHERLGLQCNDSSEESLLAARRASLSAELHFMYTIETTKTEELFSLDTKVQMGLAKSHLNCASLLHEYALRYKNLSKELEPVEVLQTVLEKASRLTQTQKEAVTEYESTAMIAPTIQPAAVEINPVLPDFSRVKVIDLFKTLGPLARFSAENLWSKPRKVILKMEGKSYGFSLKGSKPAKVSGVDEQSLAQKEGMLVGDWVLSVNGEDAKHLLHSDIVKQIQEACGDELELVITTPTLIANGKPPTPISSTDTPTVENHE